MTLHKSVFAVLAIVLQFCFPSCKPSVNYIAHAGGMIDGNAMTNSLEAVDHALQCGIRYIELDLLMTSDSILVTGHDWDMFRRITDSEPSSEPLSWDEYCSKRIYGSLTPITWKMIDSLMQAHPDMYLVTDKISTPEILEKFLGAHRDHIMVECFWGRDYLQLQDLGYHKVFLSVHPPYRETAKADRMAGEPVFENYAFWYIGKGFNEITPDYASAYGNEFAVFSMPDRRSADSLAAIDPRIRFVYIDQVEP